MAWRRALAGGLAAAGQSIEEHFKQMLADQLLRQRQAEAQRAEEAARQKAAEVAARNAKEMEFFKNNPTALAENLGKLRPNQDVAGPIAMEIDKADTPDKALSDLSIRNRFQMGGGRETLDSENLNLTPGGLSRTPNPGGQRMLADLLTQGAQRRSMLEQGEEEKRKQTTRNQYQRFTITNPDGTQTEQMMLPDDPRAAAGVQTKPNATAQGNIAGMSDAEKERVTRPGAVARAGAVAGAEARARLSAEFDPAISAKRIDEFKQRATIEASAAAQRENAVASNQAASASIVALHALNQLKPLWDSVKLEAGFGAGARNMGRRVGSATGALSYVNPSAAELDKQTDQYAMLLYRAFGGTGANVSDRDIKMLQAGLPYSWNTAAVGDKVFQNASTMLSFNPMIKGRYGMQPFEQQMKVLQSWMKLNEQAIKVGASEFEDPYTPGKTVPVIK